MLNFEYQNPTKIIFGKGSINKLANEILNYGHKVLLVYGGKSIKQNGTYDTIKQQLTNHHITTYELGAVTKPSLTNVYRGIEICKANQIDVVVGIGGGCCIDVAKSVAVGAANDVDIWDVLTKKVAFDGLNVLPIGAVATIAGSGSEMDGNSEIDNLTINQHGSIGSFQKTYPRFSILDPELTYSVPFATTAYHGVCIMIQALEQYICNTKNTPIQDGFIETICQVVMDALRTLQTAPHDYDARSQLMWASALVTNRILGRGKGAPWMAGPLGGMIDEKYGLSYTQAIAITFPKYMMVCFRDTLPLMKRFAIKVMHVDPTNQSDEAIAAKGVQQFQAFFDQIGLPHSLKDLNITAKITDFEKEIAEVAKSEVISQAYLETIMTLTIGN